jgi:CelD/BcsL family acetyltransferase involved in cellulose biosynthesis
MSQAAQAVELTEKQVSSVTSALTGHLTVELKPDLDLSAGDAAAVAVLLDSRPSIAAFVSTAWLSGYFAEPPEGFEPSLAMVREGNSLRGFAPIAVRATRGQARVRLLGGGAGSDRTDLIAARGYESACADAFVCWLGETFGKGFVFELRDVPAESSLWGAVHRANAGGSRCLCVQPREVHTLPFLELAQDGASSDRSFGHLRPASLEKHCRWLERRGRLRIERLTDLSEVTQAFEVLAQFLHTRWRDSGGGSALDNPRVARFHRHALPLLLREKRLRMLRLSAEARTIAVFYGVASRGWWGYCLAGYDREWAGRIHLGQITLATAIDVAVQEGAAEFDFLKGAHRVKYLWPVRERATLDAEVYSENTAPQLARAVWATREVVAAAGKCARGLFS